MNSRTLLVCASIALFLALNWSAFSQDHNHQVLAAVGQVPKGLAKSDWSSIQAAHQAWRHAFQPVPGETGVWQARNPGQQWHTRFDGRGFLAVPREGDWQWGLELKAYGFPGAVQEVAAVSTVKAEGQRLTYTWDARLEEWFINDQRGLEHGYTIKERPTFASLAANGGAGRSDGTGWLAFTLGVRGSLIPEVSPDGLRVNFRDTNGATVLTYAGLKVFDADGKVLISRFASLNPQPSTLNSAVTLLVDEQNARYPITIDPIAQQAFVKSRYAVGANDRFGNSVAVDGDTVVIGASWEDSSTTGGDSMPDENATDSGAAYVFVRSGTNWSQQAYLKASNTGANDQFGSSVSVSGDTVVVGAIWEASSTTGVNSTPNESASGSGAAYVFTRSGTTWSQQAYLKASNTGPGDRFGGSVAVAGDTVAVGAFGEDSSTTGVNSTPNENAGNSGAAYVFVRSGTNWSQQAYLKASNAEVDDVFGVSVSVSVNTVVVGAFGEDSSTMGVNSTPNESAGMSGAAYVFVRSETNWSQQAYLKASNTELDDRFGISVSVSENTVAVGAFLEDSSTTGVNSTPNENAGNSGAAYVFVRSGTNWSQQAYLKASNTGAGDNLGYSVSVSGDTVIVGTLGEDSSTTGVNSTPNESAADSGAAYVFVRDGTNWSQQAYLKASNPGSNDFFGGSVAVSGETMVVGAYGEDSSTTGVNSTPNELSTDSGAAYVFTRNAGVWSQQSYVKPNNTTDTAVGDNFGYRAVAVDGNTAVIGALYEDSSSTGVNSVANDFAANAGAAYVFVKNGAVWSLEAYLKGDNTEAGDQFGESVAVFGNTVVVGARLEDSSTTGVNSTPNESASAAGAAYVFVRSGSTWNQQAYLKASNTGASDYFGYSVALSGDTVVVGAIAEDSSTTGVNSTPNESAPASGAAYVFTRNAGVWSQQAYLKASNTATGDSFGDSVAVSGDTVVVGASQEDSSTTGVNSIPNESAANSGAAYVFVRSGTNWSQQAYVKASNTGAGDTFGGKVGISGNTIVVGAIQEDSSTTGVNSTPNNSANNSGAAYVFVRGGTNWTQQAYLKASNTGVGDTFGFSVSVSGDAVAVGALYEDSGTIGVNSTPNEGATDAGAAYVFVRAGTNWTQQAYLKASNTGTDDHFGFGIALSGETLVIGAPDEDSLASGVNPGSNELAVDSGAAYFFSLEIWPKVIADLPASTNVFLGSNITFQVTITGESPLYYQWYVEGSPISGATNSSFTVSNALPANARNYFVVITNSFGSVMSTVANLAVSPPPIDVNFSPIITLNGGDVVTNECHAAYTDPGATAPGATIAIAGGNFHSLALKSDGTLAVWGYFRNYVFYDEPMFVPQGLSNVVAIAAGSSHNLALTTNGAVIAWGNNDYGQSNVPAGLTNVVAVAAGYYHSLALKSGGEVVAWGNNDSGQTNIPVGLTNVIAIAGGRGHSLALKSDGTVVAWGYYDDELVAIPAYVPVGLSNVIAVAGGFIHSLALKSDGTVIAWGIGSGGPSNNMAVMSNAVAIAAGNDHSLALKSDGTIAAWGYNTYGQIDVPLSLSNVIAIDAGWGHNLALKSDGTVLAWGGNSYGQAVIPAELSSNPFLLSGSVDTNNPGIYTITYATTNLYGGVGTANRTVVVQDTLPPVITLLGANPLTHTMNVPFVDPGATALDACGSTSGVTTNSTVNIAIPGTYAVIYTSTDNSGNSVSATRWVQVVMPPLITLNGDAMITNECHAAFTDPGATATGTPLAIAAGGNHNLVLKSDGTVAAWGYNGSGETNVPAGLSNVVAIAGGVSQSFALKSDGTVAAWGYNGAGLTSIPLGLTNVVAIAGGNLHSLALKGDGTIVAWGDYNYYGQTNIPVGLSNVVAIAAGDYHSTALKRDGTIIGWGLNSYGQTNVPVGLSNVVAIAGGGSHNLALKSDGIVVAWGDNTFGQTNVPVALSNVVAIAGGLFHSLALRSDGTVVAWGESGAGLTTIPVGLSNVVAISAGLYHSLVLKSDGTIVAWGLNIDGQTNIPTGLSISLPVIAVSGSVDTNTPGIYELTYTATNILGGIGTATRTVVVQDALPPVITLLGANPLTHTMNVPFVDPGATALDVCAGGVAVTTNSTVNIAVPGTYAVTYNATDDYGNTATNTRTVQVVAPPPVIILNGSAVVTNECHSTFTDPGATAPGAPLAIAGKIHHSLALKSDGTVVAWGRNNYGQTNIPVGLSNVVAIAGGEGHSLALKSDGMVAAWGWNDYGQTTIPVGLSNVVAIAGGGAHSLALRSDGTVAAWGWNAFGLTNIPVGLSNVVAIAGGYVHSLALKSDGTVAAWGWNDYGQTTIPVGLSNVVALAGGYGHSLALKSDGTVAAWGYNANGQTNIPAGLSNVLAIAGGHLHSLALKSDGTVAAWGDNFSGQTNIPAGLSNVVSIAGGGAHSLALKSDGTVFAWGNNNYGQTNVPGGLSISLPVTVSGSVATNTPGSYLLTYTATNSLGGIGTVTRTVVVQDTLPPVLTVLGDNPFTNLLNVPFVDPGATALDACAGSVAVTTNSTVNIAVAGTYAVAYAASDSYGNATTNTRTVVVIDNSPTNSPFITLNLNGEENVTNECHAAFTDPGATAIGAPIAISAGASHSLVLRGDGTVAAWGFNDFDQTNLPVGLSNVVSISGGGLHSLALQSNGKVVTWGNSSFGQTNIPAGLSNVIAVAGGRYHSLALKSDGTVVAWGDDYLGQTHVPEGLSNVVAIAGGGYHSLALKNDGAVVAWEDNGGDETTIPAGLTNVLAIAAGYAHNLALQSDGTVVAWGNNNFGQTNVPVGLSNVVAIAGGDIHSLALRNDGTVAAWGDNDDGQTIIPVGLSNVVGIAAGGYHNLAVKGDGTVVAWGRNSYGQTNIPAGLSVLLPGTVSGTLDTNTPGSYELTYTATNILGGSGTATRTVVVQDTTPPILTVLGASPLTLLLNDPFIDPGATALDACGGSFAVTTNNTVNPTVAGIYSVTYSATDNYGNSNLVARSVAVLVAPPAPQGAAQLGDGSFQFEFTNLPGASFSVFASTNLVDWSNLGAAVEIPPASGHYRFNDQQATNHPGQFYQVRSP